MSAQAGRRHPSSGRRRNGRRLRRYPAPSMTGDGSRPSAEAEFGRGLKQLYRGLSRRRRRQFLAVMLLMIAGALAELITIGTLIPFLTLLARPNSLASIPIVGDFAQSLGVMTPRQ